MGRRKEIMNKDIELVERSLGNLIEAEQINSAARLENRLNEIEAHLKHLLRNVPEAKIHKRDTDCYATVDGINFICSTDSFYLSPRAQHKKIIKFFKFKLFVVKWETCFSNADNPYGIFDQEILKRIIQNHLEALKWEEEKNYCNQF